MCTVPLVKVAVHACDCSNPHASMSRARLPLCNALALSVPWCRCSLGAACIVQVGAARSLTDPCCLRARSLAGVCMGRLSRGACTPPACSGLSPLPAAPGSQYRRAPPVPASRRLRLDMVASKHCPASLLRLCGVRIATCSAARSTLLSLIHAGPGLHTNASLIMHQAPNCCVLKQVLALLPAGPCNRSRDVACSRD